MRRVPCSRVLKGSLCALLFTTLTAALSLWVWVESSPAPGERAMRARGCALCHGDEWSRQLTPALRQWKSGAAITPILRDKLSKAHPYLSYGAEEELATLLSSQQLPLLAAMRREENGARLYRTKCAACHGANGEGQPGNYPPLRGSEWLTATPSRLPEILTNGLQGPINVRGEAWNGIMLPPGLNGEKEVNEVIQYIRTIFSH